jgi:HK97 family phage portal protein
MNILQRVKVAGNVLVKGYSGIPVINDADFPGLSTSTFQRTSKGNKQAYVDNFTSWVYAAVSCIARNTAKVDTRLYVEKSKGSRESWEQIFDHPFLDLLRNPNPWMDMYFIKYLTEIFLGLLGNAYWYIPKNNLRLPGQIIPLLAHRVIPYSKNHVEVEYYEYLVGNSIVRFAPDEILHFKEPNPNSLILGLSPLDALLLSVDTNKAMMEYSMSLFGNGAFFGTIIKVPSEMGDADYNRLKMEIKEQFTGVSKAGKTKILRGVEEVQNLVKTMAELGFESGRKLTKKDILEGYGVPEFKLGEGSSSASSSRSNAYELDRMFTGETIQPRLMRRDSVVNKFLLPRWDEKLVCESEDVSPTDREFELQKEESRLKTGYWSINDVRALNGEEPVPWGYRPWVGMNQIQMSGYVSNDKTGKAYKHIARNMRDNWQQIKEQKWNTWVKREESIEKRYIIDLKKFFTEQQKIVLANLRRILDAGKSKGLIDFVFPSLQEQANKLTEVSRKHIAQAITFGVLTAIEFENGGKASKAEPSPEDLELVGFTPESFDIYVSAQVSQWKDLYGFTIIQTIQSDLRDLLEQAISEGWSTSHIQRDIETLYGGYAEDMNPVRSLRIARTEVSRIINDSELMCYKRLGYAEKTWATALDENVCDVCAGLDGKVVRINENFPGGFQAPPAHPNCRCNFLAGDWSQGAP